MKYFRMARTMIKGWMRARRVRRVLRLTEKIGRDSVVLPLRVLRDVRFDLEKLRQIMNDTTVETQSANYVRAVLLIKRCSFQLRLYDE